MDGTAGVWEGSRGRAAGCIGGSQLAGSSYRFVVAIRQLFHATLTLALRLLFRQQHALVDSKDELRIAPPGQEQISRATVACVATC